MNNNSEENKRLSIANSIARYKVLKVLHRRYKKPFKLTKRKYISEQLFNTILTELRANEQKQAVYKTLSNGMLCGSEKFTKLLDYDT